MLAVMPIFTIPLSARKAGPFTAAAAQTVFPFALPIYAAGDLDVWRERAGVVTQLAEGVDYTVSGAGEQSGGNVVLTAGALVGDIIAIDGGLLQQRATSFSGGNPFQALTIDTDLNRLAIMVQELGREVGRSIRRAAVDESSGSLALPQVSQRSLLAIDTTGALIDLPPLALGIDGQFFIQDGGGAVVRSYLNKNRWRVDVEDYGDVSTDALGCINRAIDYVNIVGGGEVQRRRALKQRGW